MFVRVKATITRPNDTTTYAAGDVIGTAASQVLVFDLTSTPFYQGRGTLLNAILTSSASPALLPNLELWVFSASPAVGADNTAWAATDGDLLNLVGIYPFASTYLGGASGNHAQLAAAQAWPFEMASGAGTLYGVLVVRNAYVPVANEVYQVVLTLAD